MSAASEALKSLLEEHYECEPLHPSGWIMERVHRAKSEAYREAICRVDEAERAIRRTNQLCVLCGGRKFVTQLAFFTDDVYRVQCVRCHGTGSEPSSVTQG